MLYFFNYFKTVPNLSGEVEAYNVESRLKIPKEERKRILAQETEDVSREDQVFLYENSDYSYVVNYKAIREFLINGDVVARVEGNPFSKKEGLSYVEQVVNYFNSIDNEATSLFGKVLLDKRAVKNSIGHGIGTKKSASFTAVKDVLENGVVILPMDYYDVHNKKQQTGMIAAPILLDGERYICVVEVIKNKENNRLYTHEVTLQKNLLDVRSSPSQVQSTILATNQGDIAKILQNIVKPINKNQNVSNNIEILSSVSGNVLGWVENGEIYLTPEGLNSETLIHEYTHLWVQCVKKLHPKKWDEIKNTLKSCKELWDAVVNDPMYSDIKDDEDAVTSEVLSRFSGKDGEQRMLDALDNADKKDVKSIISKAKKAIKDFWNEVVKLFGLDTKSFSKFYQCLL